ncbi:Arylsulfatase precursor [Planctomycetes bacterium Pan216]|uniref:Arylsulfatase n=1 Tax=Kolteria novifilia TaxID=2527975 RepID=A0A518B0J3_9BACT|nr:Arylsulfatase precursor [Planctomycetes bacterium Pan216]
MPSNPTLLTSLLLLLPTALCASEPPKPNIILAMADDQGWGDTSYNGHEILKTPIMDEMAETGLRLDRFYAAAPVCSPTRGSVMTGRHPNRFGCFVWGSTLRPQEITVAEALKTAGYTTGHFGKWHLGSVQADSPVSPGKSGFDEWVSSPNFYENDPLFSHNGKVIETKGESSRVTVDAALDFIRSANDRKQPFLAVIWFGNPHSPHEALDELREPYKDQPLKDQHYYGEMAGIDQAMGHLRTELRSLGIAENTLVWYTSDNGSRAPGSTGGLRGHKGQLWEGGIRVPSIIEWPAVIKKPSRSDFPCGTIDIYPTVLQVAGVTMPHQPKLDGESLLPLIEGEAMPKRAPLGFWTYPQKGSPMRSHEMLEELAKQQLQGIAPKETPHANAGDLSTQYATDDRQGDAALIDGDYKLHRMTNKKSGKTHYELYNLTSDQSETKDIAKKEPKRTKSMKASLEAWQRSVIDSLNGKDYQ